MHPTKTLTNNVVRVLRLWNLPQVGAVVPGEGLSEGAIGVVRRGVVVDARVEVRCVSIVRDDVRPVRGSSLRDEQIGARQSGLRGQQQDEGGEHT